MTTGQSLAEGAAGVALQHIEVEAWDAAFAALTAAVAEGVSIGDGASLYHGAPALSFVLHSVADQPRFARAAATVNAGTATVTRQRLEAAHRRIDRHQRPLYAEYDLIGGLTGLGVVLRRTGNTDLLGEVLAYLVRLTEQIGDLPGWWCRNGPNRDRPTPAGGHANHGMAHGITGLLAFLALTHLDGIRVNGHTDAITRICRWLDIWERRTEDGSAWWPQTVTLTDLEHGEPAQRSPLRPSWCYGTPGIARAQQLAARALAHPARQAHAESAFIACVQDPAQLRRLVDRTLCHGTAGVLATARRLATDSLTPIPVAPLEDLHQRKSPATVEPPGFLNGRAGVTFATTTTGWDACLLLS